VPVRFNIDIDKRSIETTAASRVTYTDLFEFYRSLRSHPNFANDLCIIFDATLAEGFDLDYDGVRRLSSVSDQFTKLDPPLRVAIIAPGDLAFGLSRMYETMKSASPGSVKVFRDRALAEDWAFGRSAN